MPTGLTIGQASAFADVTTKTIRHYHRLGLVDEPERDSSGYRRYSSAELLQIVRVRTLSRAGIPLAEIPAILEADPSSFAASIADIDRRLGSTIAELENRRKTLHRLDSGDRALLPDSACAVLDRLHQLDFSPEAVDAYRESLILFKALFAADFDEYLRRFETVLADPDYTELIKRIWAAGSWQPDDPRAEQLANAMADHMLRHQMVVEFPSDLRTTDNAIRYGLINHHKTDPQSPTWDQLTALIEQRLRAAGVALPLQ